MRVGVVGAGTMGAGIAQVAAIAGAEVGVYEVDPARREAAAQSVTARLSRLGDTGRLADADEVPARIRFCGGLSELAGSELVVEAAIESMSEKAAILRQLEDVVASTCIVASNTSSLSITALAAHLEHPARCCGMHFFNPATAMPLVEVVSAAQTDPAVLDVVADTARGWGKTPVRCASSPGFLVNRVARPFYGEAHRLVEERAADPATIDRILTAAAGFRMGPFELTDLIGQDVSLAVATSIWTDTFGDPRYAPTRFQRDLVDAGRLGRKSGRGVYEYGPETPPRKASAGAPLEVTATELPCGAELRPTDGRTATAVAAAAGRPVVLVDLVGESPGLVALAVSDGAPAVAEAEAASALGRETARVEDVPGLVVARTVAMLVNEAVDVVARGVASAADVDLAMRLGTGYPLGPLEWGDRVGAARVVAILEALHAAYPTGRYRVTPRLRRAAISGTPLLSLE